MNDDTCNLFKRVAQKMGWASERGLDEAEEKVRIICINKCSVITVISIYNV